MSWNLRSVQDNADDITVEIESQSGNDRETGILDVVVGSVEEIVAAVGGYISVSAYGHINPAEGEPNDQVTIQIVSLPVPGGETRPPADAATLSEPVAAPEGELAPASNAQPDGSVAPPAGAEAAQSGDGTPGLESVPAEPETAVPESDVAPPEEGAPVEEEIVEPTDVEPPVEAPAPDGAEVSPADPSTPLAPPEGETPPTP